MPNAHVFAGGAVDVADGSELAYLACANMDDLGASRHLNLASNGLRFFIAAIREAFEECGLLLAYDALGQWVDLEGWDQEEVRSLRARLSSGDVDLATMCRSNEWRLAVDAVAYFSHWITPPGLSHRFDTRFFIGRAPPRQHASLVGAEMSHMVWRTAADALADHTGGRLTLMLATQTILKEIAAFVDLDALLAYAWSERKILPTTPLLRAE